MGGYRTLMSRFRRFPLIVCGLLLSCMLVACGVPAATTAPAPAPSTPPAAPTAVAVAIQPAPTAAPAAQPKRGGSFTVRQWTADPPDLDPFLNVSFRVQQFAGYIYSRLLQFERGPSTSPNASIVRGDLAEKWEVSSDGLTYTFYLRKNAKFHNKAPVNGRAVTADDVVYSFERFMKVSPQKAQLGMVKDAKKVDANTVAFTLNQIFAPFEVAIASPILFIMPKEVIEADGDARKNPLGSGPFMYDKYEKGVQMTYKRNPDYYVEGQPYVDEVVSLIIPEDATAVAGLRSKAIDLNGVSATDYLALKKSNPEIEMTRYEATTVAFFYWKIDKPPFNDERVRQAVSLAMDRDESIKVIYEGEGVYQSAVPVHFASFHIKPASAEMGEGAKYYKRDVAAARKLLADAGYPTGLKVPFIASLNAYGNTFNQGVEIVIKHLKEAGIEADLKPQDYSAYIASTFLGKFDAPNMVWGLQTPYQDPHDYLYNMYHPKGIRNHNTMNDPMLTEMIEKQVVTLDKADRKRQIDEIQRYLAVKQYYTFGSVGFVYNAVQPWVKNAYFTNDYGNLPLLATQVWLDNKPK